VSRNYSPRNFLRKTPNALLERYFESRKIPLEIDWQKLEETDVEPVYEAILKLKQNDLIKVEKEFRQVNEMACAKGTLCLLEEGESPFHNLKLADRFEQMSDPYEKAMWMFLEHPKVFEIAESLYRMDSVGGWKHCGVYQGLEPKVEPEDLEKFAAKISEFYQKQGRGKHCHVENYLRQNPERHCYFAYPEDYARTELEYEDDVLKSVGIKPAFEVIFVYRPDTGILETNAGGKADDVKKLQESFCQTILGLEKLPDATSRIFKLEKLKNDFQFPTNPKEGIKKVYLKMLQLELPGGRRRKITFEDGSNEKGQPIYQLIENALNQETIPLDQVKAVKAKIQFQFEGVNGKPGKTLTFEIALPDRCTLKDDPLHQIAKKYLEEWGLMERFEIPPMPESDQDEAA
jgi:hypothetical protein